MVNSKIISWLILGYGIFYVVFPHEIHQKYSLDWLGGSLFGGSGFPHSIHVILGVVLIIYGFLLLQSAVKLPKFLGKLYGHKEEY